MINWTLKAYFSLETRYPMIMKICRFIISGGTAAFTNLLLLFIFTDIFHIWYIMSAVMAFIIAFVVSFFLQKNWTYRDTRKDDIHRQMMMYLTIAVINLCLNTILLYCLVEYVGIYYILSQMIASIIISVESYFIYQVFVFNKVQQIQ